MILMPIFHLLGFFPDKISVIFRYLFPSPFGQEDTLLSVFFSISFSFNPGKGFCIFVRPYSTAE